MKRYIVEYDASETERWYLNGKLHREHGPAIIYKNGDEDYYLNNVNFSKEEWGLRLNLNKIVIIDGVIFKLIKV